MGFVGFVAEIATTRSSAQGRCGIWALSLVYCILLPVIHPFPLRPLGEIESRRLHSARVAPPASAASARCLRCPSGMACPFLQDPALPHDRDLRAAREQCRERSATVFLSSPAYECLVESYGRSQHQSGSATSLIFLTFFSSYVINSAFLLQLRVFLFFRSPILLICKIFSNNYSQSSIFWTVNMFTFSIDHMMKRVDN
jgi:hypothetical protein